MSRLPVFFLVLTGLLYSCSSGETDAHPSRTSPVQAATNELPGQNVYQKNCKICHGSKGDLGLSGAADLKKSQLSLEERIQVITNGRNGMAPHKDILSEDEIRQVAAYLETLHDQ